MPLRAFSVRAARLIPSRFIPFLALGLALGPARAAEWESIPFREPIPVASVLAVGNAVWVADSTGLRASGDSGGTWRTLATLPGSGAVYGLYGRWGFEFALRSGALYRSGDSGATWSKVMGDSMEATGRRFLARGDSLFYFNQPYPPYWVMLSLDQGRNWALQGYSTEETDSAMEEPEAGLGVRLLRGDLSRSADGGANWEALPRPPPEGPFISLAAGQGWIYAVAEPGLAFRMRSGSREWQPLSPGLRAGIISDLAASGRNLCVTAGYGISCSRDGGAHFAFMGMVSFANGPPFSYAGRASALAVDGDRVYVAGTYGNGPGYLWQRRLDETGTWGKTRFNGTDSVRSTVVAARDGLLTVMARVGSSSDNRVFASRNQGASFESFVPLNLAFQQPLTDVGNPLCLGKPDWALYTRTMGILLSPDSGRTWRTLSWETASMGASDMAVFDSVAYFLNAGGKTLNTLSFKDFSRRAVPEAGVVTAVAGSDSVLYAFGDGQLRKRNIYDTPAAGIGAPGRKAKARPFGRAEARIVFPAGGPNRDALGKRAE